MRYKDPFTLYTRETKIGKKVFFYRFYDEDGKRTSGKTTGTTVKSVAIAYVNDLIRNGLLSTNRDITFETYSENWWVWD
ncbi:MAG: integrase, partial [Spirochaetia bacterium]|nr:integrase [Spirochaetia bacterium]